MPSTRIAKRRSTKYINSRRPVETKTNRNKQQANAIPQYMPGDLPKSVRNVLKVLYPRSQYWKHE